MSSILNSRVKALADNFEMQQAQKPAAKTKAKRGGGFHLKVKACIVQAAAWPWHRANLQTRSYQRGTGRKTPRIARAQNRSALRAGFLFIGDRIANAGISHLLDGGGEKADFPRSQEYRSFPAWGETRQRGQ